MQRLNIGNSLKILTDRINRKRRAELISLYASNSEIQRYMKDIRNSGMYEKGSKSKVWRKIASMPPEVDQFFTKIYGREYFKEKDFFTKYASEWATIRPDRL